MKTFDPVTVFFVILGVCALSFIADPIEYLGACFVYGLGLATVKVMIYTIHGNDDES